MNRSNTDVEGGTDETTPIAASSAGGQYQTMASPNKRTTDARWDAADELAECEGSPYLPACNNGHYPCLDVVRIICVWLACVDHAGTKHGVWNTMYVQSWVLQYLYYVCGFCFAMSSRSICSYNARLSVYFIVGVSLNCIAWELTGMDWKHNMFGAVFQFWFVFGLMLFLFLLTPLKWHLKGFRVDGEVAAVTPRTSRNQFWVDCGTGFALIVLGCSFIKLFYDMFFIPLMIRLLTAKLQPVLDDLGESSKFWGVQTTNATATAGFIQEFFSDSELSVSNTFIALVFPMLSKRMQYTLWIIFLNTYMHKCFCYRSQTTRFLTAYDSTLIGLTFYFCGFAGRRVIGEYLIRYWFLFLFACSLLWQPGMFGRLDESPPTDLATRASYNALEFWFALLFVGSIERMVDPKIFSQDKLQFMGYWSLLIFLVHKFCVILVTPELYWVILVTLIPVCYLCFGHRRIDSERLCVDT